MGKIQSITRNSKKSNICWSRYIGISCCILWLSSCSTLKQAGMVGASAGAGAIAGTVLSGGVVAPVLGATTTAFVADAVVSGAKTSEVTNQVIQEAQIIQEAESNFFTLLEKLVDMGGWLLILIFVVPMILGWIIPGPLKLNRKNKT